MLWNYRPSPIDLEVLPPCMDLSLRVAWGFYKTFALHSLGRTEQPAPPGIQHHSDHPCPRQTQIVLVLAQEPELEPIGAL